MSEDNSDDATETALKQIADLATFTEEKQLPNGKNDDISTEQKEEIIPFITNSNDDISTEEIIPFITNSNDAETKVNEETVDEIVEEKMDTEEQSTEQTDITETIQPPQQEEAISEQKEQPESENEKKPHLEEKEALVEEKKAAPDPSKLTFISSGDGYHYYSDVNNAMFTQDESGYWYYQSASGDYQICDEVKATEKDDGFQSVVPIGPDGHPKYPLDMQGRPVLPINEKGEKVFPLGKDGFPLFPFDRHVGRPTFPIGDDGQPVFPIGSQGKPIVPIDSDGRPVFPVGPDGMYIFPVGKDGQPTAPVTAQGRAVLPLDKKGKAIVPYKDGKPLIALAPDGVTPLDPEVVQQNQQWADYYQQYQQYYQQMQTPQQPPPQQTAHGYAGFSSSTSSTSTASNYWNWQQNLKTTKRVRPEDIDLPEGPSPKIYEPTRPLGDLTEAHFGATPTDKSTRLTLPEEKKQATKNLLQKQLKSMAKQRSGKTEEHESTPKPYRPVPVDRPPKPDRKTNFQLNVMTEMINEEKKKIESLVEEKKAKDGAREHRKSRRSRSSSADSWGSRKSAGGRSNNSRREGRSRSRTSGDRHHNRFARPIYSNPRRSNPHYNQGGRGRTTYFHGKDHEDGYDRRRSDDYNQHNNRKRNQFDRRRSEESDRSHSKTPEEKIEKKSKKQTPSKSKSKSPVSSAHSSPTFGPDPVIEKPRSPVMDSKKLHGPQLPEQHVSSSPKPIAPVKPIEEAKLTIEVVNQDNDTVMWPKNIVQQTVTVPMLEYSCKPEFYTSSFVNLKQQFEESGGARRVIKELNQLQPTESVKEEENKQEESDEQEQQSDEEQSEDEGKTKRHSMLIQKWKPLQPEDIKITINQESSKNVRSKEKEEKSAKPKKRKRAIDPELQRLRGEALASMETAKKLLEEVERRGQEEEEENEETEEEPDDDEEDEVQEEEEEEQVEEEKKPDKKKKRKLAQKERKRKKRERRKRREKKERKRKRRHASSGSESEEESTSDEDEEEMKKKRKKRRKRGSSDDLKKRKHKKRTHKHSKKHHKHKETKEVTDEEDEEKDSKLEQSADQMELEDIDSKSDEPQSDQERSASDSESPHHKKHGSHSKPTDSAILSKFVPTKSKFVSGKHELVLPSDDNPVLRSKEYYTIEKPKPMVKQSEQTEKPPKQSSPHSPTAWPRMVEEPKRPSRFDQKPVDQVDIFSEAKSAKKETAKSDYDLYDDALFDSSTKSTATAQSTANVDYETVVQFLQSKAQSDPEYKHLLSGFQKKAKGGFTIRQLASDTKSSGYVATSDDSHRKTWKSLLSSSSSEQDVPPPPPPPKRQKTGISYPMSDDKERPPPPPPKKKFTEREPTAHATQSQLSPSFPSQPLPPGVVRPRNAMYNMVPVATYHTLPLGTLPPPGVGQQKSGTVRQQHLYKR